MGATHQHALADLPERYPPYQTCHRRFQEWVKASAFDAILIALFDDLERRGGIDLRECFIDGTFVRATKGGIVLASPKPGRAARSWPWQTLLVFLSPFTLNLLHRTRSGLYLRLSNTPGLGEYLNT